MKIDTPMRWSPTPMLSIFSSAITNGYHNELTQVIACSQGYNSISGPKDSIKLTFIINKFAFKIADMSN